MTQPGMISHGMPPMADDLARRVRDLERAMEVVRGRSIQAVNLAQAAISQIQAWNAHGTYTMHPGDSKVTMLSRSVQVPAGFTRLSTYMGAYIGAEPSAGSSYEFQAAVYCDAFSGGLIGAPQGDSFAGDNLDPSFGAVVTMGAGLATGLVPGSNVTWTAEGWCSDSRTATINTYLSGLIIWQP